MFDPTGLTPEQKKSLVKMLSEPQVLEGDNAAMRPYVREVSADYEEGRRPDGRRYGRKIYRYSLTPLGEQVARVLARTM